MSEISQEISKIRKDYSQHKLEEDSVAYTPAEQFRIWMDEVLQSELPEPNAMSLATVNAEGQPSLRMVLLRGFDERGFVFFTNYNSRKGRELSENPQGALCFFWPELERQIRIEGKVVQTSPEESDAYFETRPKGNRLGAWASPQSEVIEDRTILEDLVTKYENEFEGTEVHRPEFWGGFRLQPKRVEFWQGRPSRLHDRIRYEWDGKQWAIERLAP